ncbi:MAG: beta-lactamase family protein [Parvularculaceae bacterium]|nr:beta-lactamase family protein [Parvularculaceae bacterium]
MTAAASGDFPVSGFADAPFGRVRDAFALNFAEGTELGARFCVFVEGRCVVDLVGGYADRAREIPWTDDTLAGIYSSGKLVVALLVARAVSDGKLDYDAPVARWWPEFAPGGKADVTLAEALSHQSGIVGFADEAPADIWLDWDRTTSRLAAMAPLFPPRSASGYGPQSFGFIAGEVLRRATGRGVARQLREDFGDVDLHCALRPEEIARAAYMPKPPRAPDLGPLTELKRVAFLKPWSAPGGVTREAWMAAEIPSANIHATARALAELAHPFANLGVHRGARIIGAGALAAALEERIVGDDLVLPFRLSWAAGFMRNINGHFGPSGSAFGHAGFGGSSVMFDPVHRISAAYVMNRMSPHLVGDPRGLRLVNAVYDAL